jgi:hypothetical protein
MSMHFFGWLGCYYGFYVVAYLHTFDKLDNIEEHTVAKYVFMCYNAVFVCVSCLGMLILTIFIRGV